MRGVRRVELVVVGAIVLSIPSIQQAFSGGIAPTSALLRLAGALALCWAVGAVVERTLDTYARQARQKELAERIEQLRAARASAAPMPQVAQVNDSQPPMRVDNGQATPVQ